MALALQEGGVTRPDIDGWLAAAFDTEPTDVRNMVIRHMLATGILTEDSGVIGLGRRGEREFGRRHFSDLIAAFSDTWLLTVLHSPRDLGVVHPASLARRSGKA
jgi:ATP-dependent Lhr-like helicase